MVIALLLACAMMIAVSMVAMQGAGASVFMSFVWGIVNCFAAALGGFIVFLIFGRR